MNIHEEIKDKHALAEFYAEDGAFATAARVMRQLAAILETHAERCQKDLDALINAN